MLGQECEIPMTHEIAIKIMSVPIEAEEIRNPLP